MTNQKPVSLVPGNLLLVATTCFPKIISVPGVSYINPTLQMLEIIAEPLLC